MNKFALPLLVAAFFGAPVAHASENRCGWVDNPTPGNWTLTDADGQWIIMSQGGFEAGGMENIGDISAGDYVATNGNYGYACGCMRVDTSSDGYVTQVYSFRQSSIGKCENDGSLPPPQ